jgi:predicted amidohydrolase
MQVSLGQMSPTLGNVEANLQKHHTYIDEAISQQSNVVVFPELGVTGYQVQDLTLDVARTLTSPDIRSLIARSRDIDLLFSFVEETESHLFYISSVYASAGQVTAVHRKVYLPTYGVFDDRRYFAPGQEFRTFATPYTRAGILICEDAWHGTSPYLLSLGGANLIYVPSASPARSVSDLNYFGSQKSWRDMLQVYAQLYGTPIVFVNRVGFEDGLSFFGGSGVVSAVGEWLLEAPTVQAGLFTTTIDLGATRRARYATPILRDERPLLVAKELKRILAAREGGSNR